MDRGSAESLRRELGLGPARIGLRCSGETLSEAVQANSLRILTSRFLLFAALSIADLILTFVLLYQGGGVVIEGNPVANALLMHYGQAGMVAFKLADVVLVGWLVLLLGLSRPEAARRLLSAGCAIVGLVTLYSSWLIVALRFTN
jgi:hypothetical protein